MKQETSLVCARSSVKLRWFWPNDDNYYWNLAPTSRDRDRDQHRNWDTEMTLTSSYLCWLGHNRWERGRESERMGERGCCLVHHQGIEHFRIKWTFHSKKVNNTPFLSLDGCFCVSLCVSLSVIVFFSQLVVWLFGHLVGFCGSTPPGWMDMHVLESLDTLPLLWFLLVVRLRCNIFGQNCNYSELCMWALRVEPRVRVYLFVEPVLSQTS